MIVCWVLFSIGAVTVLVGWAGYEYYDAKVHSYAEQHNLNADSRNWDPNDLLTDKLINPARIELDRLRDIRDSLPELAVFGAVVAAVFLPWNILCHTAHWIWQGRKVQ